jgi:dephospho-CoA kinase
VITIVTGPPCGGKSTIINESCKSGDIIIDMDRIALALTTPDVKPFEYDATVRRVAMMARKGAVAEALKVAQGERYLGVWIIHTDPSQDERRMYRALGATIVEANPGKAECLRRLALRPKENYAIGRKVIDEYFAKR